MTNDYPYLLVNGKIIPIIESLIRAAKPPRFSQNFLEQLGYASTNDRAIIPLLKKLGFLNEDGSPTEYYDQLRDPSLTKKIMASKIRELYSELFAINVQINKASDEEVRGAISRVTGKDADSVNRYFYTFRTLCEYADFSNTAIISNSPVEVVPNKETFTAPLEVITSQPTFHYNIQIHLPATTDLSVYNAIFKSLKENLIV